MTDGYTASSGPKRLAVLDIETTGLAPGSDLILEVGMVIVDSKLDEIAHHCVLIASPRNVAWAKQTFAQWDRPAPLTVAQRMHLNNWLISDLHQPLSFAQGHADGTHTAVTGYQQATELLCAFLDEQGIIEPVPLVGSSVRSLDGPFLELHMPKLFSRFTHRTIDASALTELARFMDPRGYEDLSAATPDSGHRTIEDCRRSIGIIRAFARRYGIGSFSAGTGPTTPTS
ncbi:oligoribonuclease [Mycobacteroides abscessus subsp. bolletii]|uniref:Oligoribonuclease n=1 Tax=Mycobacteroides abscessus subsp. bolletii TaxID=319705 RepID=A0A9Q7SA49_9MYCO|nr:exonuclease [Mycobacteroides abscessus]SHT90295.1 oligoribonuclease [Mycobacteroides abscessus subsp. bolletii]SHU02996.1 oligoribonuclease [Mycobacteroides abscessus subsp. bolletii]SHW81972.1 oligoribonuclease [Mycobacteroides abscessus subsp. bolletii]SIC63913.1 oligoribonuclease [Mycobacteroides abscessus subsp. abscessus]SKL85178.1 oligoribonuclease [Mycobacteroides abscessus subsp. bolletii]